MADYGATVDGVRALLPHVSIGSATRPSEDEVEAWLGDFSGEVAVKLGPVSGDAALRAKRLVETAVAAVTYDAAFPEHATRAGDNRYGAILWSRYLAGMAAIAVEVEEGDLPSAAAGSPIFSFPPPLFARDTAL